MKPARLAQLSRSIISALAFVCSATLTLAQLPANSSIALAPGTTPGTLGFTLTDPANNLYVVQSSTDLVTWTDIATWKLHNGSFHRAFSHDPVLTPRRFFRAVFDPARNDIQSTLATALVLPATPANYASPSLPSAFLAPVIAAQDNTPANNPVTDAGALLGRTLFYDKRLSLNRTVSCASCHSQAHGFADPRPLSVGFAGGLTGRNSMGLANARWYQRKAMFWDERAATLEAQVLQPIQDSVEMGMTLPALVTRLGAEPYYATLFTNAFGSAEVTTDRISKALAQFVRSIVSTQTKYDAGVAVGFTNFTAQENLGRQIFFSQFKSAGCSSCHGTDNFVPSQMFNNGLENPYVDKGLGGRTGLPRDEGLFKAPSLRNIALTAPYMHDGRFATLEQVVEFYNSGVVDHLNLSSAMKFRGDGTPRNLDKLTTTEQSALVAFLRALTDEALTNDPKFADPFNYGD
jgi:cytochrome c peroxidase